MTVADWALAISICSAVVSLAGFVWNVWSKFIYPKPNVAVSFQYMTMLVPAPDDSPSLVGSENSALALFGTNMGPIGVTLYLVVVAEGLMWWRLRPRVVGTLNPLPEFPAYPGQFSRTAGAFGGGLPKKVEVGEQFAVYFVPDHEALSKDDIDRIGFSDTFGRLHWAPKKHVVDARKHIREAIAKRPA